MLFRKAKALTLLCNKENQDLRRYYLHCLLTGRKKGQRAIIIVLTDPTLKGELSEFRFYARNWDITDEFLFRGGLYFTEETAQRHAQCVQEMRKLETIILTHTGRKEDRGHTHESQSSGKTQSRIPAIWRW